MLYFSVTVLATTHAQHGTEECFFCMLVAKDVKASKNKASALCEVHLNSVGARNRLTGHEHAGACSSFIKKTRSRGYYSGDRAMVDVEYRQDFHGHESIGSGESHIWRLS